MKIRTRLTLLYTLVTGVMMLVFAFIVFYSAMGSREKEFYSLLRQEALTKANLFFEARVEEQTLQDIYRSNREIINEVEVAIYDTNFNLLYHDALDIDFVKETPEMMNEILEKGNISFFQEGWQVTGLTYYHNGGLYLLTSAAYDGYGHKKLHNLRSTIIWVLVSSLIIIFLAGYFFSRQAFEPVKEITDKVRNISATSLDLRLPATGSRDEISVLAGTFNEMLDRLENSFDAQKDFVSNISHELRTPLAAIIAELDLSSSRERNAEEYRESIELALSDARRLKKLLNSLLDLAKAGYDPSEIHFRPVRLDELLLDARQHVQQMNHLFRVDIAFADSFDNEDQITVLGNEYLLKVAFVNLLENGCKFADDKRCVAGVSFGEKTVIVEFRDKGPGIPDDELPLIFNPFFRGSNQYLSDGNGIGLALTQKIIKLHNGRLDVISNPGMGSVFTVRLLYLNSA